MEKNQIVKLLPANKRLKQVIKEHGNCFRIVAPPAPLQCFDNAEGVLVESIKTKHLRNVLITNISEES
jgi:hypothetical protein